MDLKNIQTPVSTRKKEIHMEQEHTAFKTKQEKKVTLVQIEQKGHSNHIDALIADHSYMSQFGDP